MSMPTMTVYVSTVDVTTLNGILNGVAILCDEEVFIWGFAMLASMWSLLAGVTKAPLVAASGSSHEGILMKSGTNAVLPFILAMLLTLSGFQGRVQVESTINGNVTVVDNVPFVIYAIPAAISDLSTEWAPKISAAFNANTGLDYTSISSDGNGFLNPLKVLLTSRSALNRLNSISSEVNAVVTDCLGPTSGINYSTLHSMVINAGNSGATAAQSIPINGVNPTTIGALLFHAAQTTGFVISLDNGGGEILSCNDAAILVANNITAALNSLEFERVVQGAVNGMDIPHAAGRLTISSIQDQWYAARNANTVGAAMSVGAAQASQEVINMLSSEIVKNELECVSTSSSNKANCQAALVQANEIERANIMAAAAEVPMLKYAGNLGNQMLALIIGIGPIIVLLMMFTGGNSAKALKTAAHIAAWPILVTNVGAEIINMMMYVTVSNFTTSLAGGGVITQAQAPTLYKELSIQIGSASNLMASLPIIMGMIFAISEFSTMGRVASKVSPSGSDVRDSATPSIHQQQALSSTSGLLRNKMTAEGGSVMEYTGSMANISARTSMGRMATNALRTFSESDRVSKEQQNTEQVSQSTDRAFSTGNFKEFGFNAADTKTLSDIFTIAKSQTESDRSYTSFGDDRSTSTQTNIAASGSASKGSGSGGGGLGLGVSAASNVNATNTEHKNTGTSRDNAIRNSEDNSNTLQKMIQIGQTMGVSDRILNDLTQRRSSQEKYTESLSHSHTTDDTLQKSLQQTNELDAYASQVSDEMFLSGVHRNNEFGNFMLLEGEKLKQLDSVNKNYQYASNDQATGMTAQIANDPVAKEAITMFRAAQMTSQDTGATNAERLEARRFLANAMANLTHTSPIATDNIKSPTLMHDKPANETGIPLPSQMEEGGRGIPKFESPMNADGSLLQSEAQANFDKESSKLINGSPQNNVNPTHEFLEKQQQVEEGGLSQESTAIRAGQKAIENTEEVARETVEMVQDGYEKTINTVKDAYNKTIDTAGDAATSAYGKVKSWFK